ncbi:hypothetical protein [Thermoanaerobacterium thermosaccharolyticum]
MDINFMKKNDILIAKVKGELDHHTSDIFKELKLRTYKSSSVP